MHLSALPLLRFQVLTRHAVRNEPRQERRRAEVCLFTAAEENIAVQYENKPLIIFK